MTELPHNQVDFAVDTLGPLVLFLPSSSDAEVWSLTGGFQSSVRWLGVFLLEPESADITLRKIIADGFRVRLDGRLIQC
jgi:hypothetical protein